MAEQHDGLMNALVQLAAGSLLDRDHLPARIAASGLAFNLAAGNQVSRARTGKDALTNDVQIELIAAMVEALGSEESSKEVVSGLAMALGLMVYMAPVDGEVLELCRGLEIGEVVRGKETKKLIEGQGVREAVDILKKGL
jgi:hypothetical protein